MARSSKTSPSSEGDEEGRYRTRFGAALDSVLSQSGSTWAALARGTGKSQSYVSQTAQGARRASPEWVNLVSNTLRLQEEQRRALHKAAARDAGYEVEC